MRAFAAGGSRSLGLALALGVSLGLPEAAASPTLVGSTGLIKIPTGEVLEDGELAFGFSWIGGPRSYLYPPQVNRMYYAALGLWPGVEISLDMLQVVGWYDPLAPGVAHAIHRLSNVKYRLPLPDGWPSVAVGAQDPVSVNAVVRGAVGQTYYGLNTFYGVASHPVGPVTLHLGYGQSPKFIQGVFGGADWTLGESLNLRAEYDSRQVNAGLYWQPFDWLSLHGARLFPDDWAYGTVLTWRL